MEVKETTLEDWGIYDDDDKNKKENEPKPQKPNKNNNPPQNKNQISQKQQKTKNEKSTEESPSKIKKLKPKERDDDEKEEEPKKSKKNKKSNKSYEGLLTHMKNIQSDADKKIKKKTYSLLENYINENEMTDECYDLLIRGDQEKGIEGICELISKKTRLGDFKGSTIELLKIIYNWFESSPKSSEIIENFSINEDCVLSMKIGDHYSHMNSSNKKEDKKFALNIIKIIKKLLDKRKTLELKDLVKHGFIKEIQQGLEKLKQVETKKTISQNKEKIPQKEKSTNEKNPEIPQNDIDEDINPISLEPKTWDAVEKTGKRLLTIDFLASNPNAIDDTYESELEMIENFIDPVSNNKKLNITNFNEDEIKQMHIQMDTFNPAFFLEKTHKKISLDDFASAIIEIDNNLQKLNQKDEKLIDNNIYKYLDCKKLLDSILQKFNENSSTLITSFNTHASSLQYSINDKLSDVKKNFDQILKAKMCKEIIQKLSKYFVLKDKIEENLKFSNIDELADILKRVNVELKNISQNRLVYGEFFIYFSQKIDDFKNKLIEIIKNAPVKENVLKYFKYLLEFEIELEIIEQLLSMEKVKMCDKIKLYLENTENFEINNYREFFCDEYPLQNISDSIYMQIIKNAENKIINEPNNNKAKKKKIYDEISTKYPLDMDMDNNNLEKNNDEKDELINVENIIKSILEDINEFLFTMKVLDEMLTMKSIYQKRSIKFNTITSEIYYVLFDKLKTFLFDYKNFEMEKIIQENYFSIYKLPANNYVNKIQQFYLNNKDLKNIVFNTNFNKNTLHNLSNLVVEIFEKFEYHLSKDVIGNLNKNKNIFIKKIFYAFINEQILSNIDLFRYENTINYTDTQVTIFNQSSFNFTKTFFKHFIQSYINIIKFYMNIVNKLTNITIEYDLIYDSFFFILKCFVLRFLVYYRTEKKDKITDSNCLNCLVIETFRNLNYIEYTILTILNRLFKNKQNDYDPYLKDFLEFISLMKNLFIKQYSVNAANNLISIFINNTTSTENAKNKFNFYEKYNELLISKLSDKNIFSDYRSSFIDLLNAFSNYTRDLSTIFEEEKKDNKDKRIMKILQYIISLFFDKFVQEYSSGKTKIFSGDDESQKTISSFKYNAQLLLEMQLFIQLLNKYINTSGQLKEKSRIAVSVILNNIANIKRVNFGSGNINEKQLFTDNEIRQKDYIINRFLQKYSSFYKIFT